MASMNCKRMVAVATLATSVVLMGGAAFAAPAPDPVNKAVTTARNTEVDVLNQIKRTFAGSMGTTTGLGPDRVGKAVETARNTAADGLNQIKRTF